MECDNDGNLSNSQQKSHRIDDNRIDRFTISQSAFDDLPSTAVQSIHLEQNQSITEIKDESLFVWKELEKSFDTEERDRIENRIESNSKLNTEKLRPRLMEQKFSTNQVFRNSMKKLDSAKIPDQAGRSRVLVKQKSQSLFKRSSKHLPNVSVVGHTKNSRLVGKKNPKK